MLNRSTVTIALVALPLLLALTPSGARAQCDNPKTSVQRAQCVGDELRGADRTINRVYGDLMKSLSPADRLTLRNDQRSWLKMRDQNTVCVVRLTNDRVQTLYDSQKSNAVLTSPAPAVASDSAPVYDLFTHEPKAKGKWYFEIRVDEPAIQRLAEATFSTGVVQAVADEAATNERGGSYGSLITIRRIDKNVELYTLGYALDLDNGKLYISINGEWDGGAPGSSGGLDLIRGRAYKGELSSSVSINPFLSSHL